MTCNSRKIPYDTRAEALAARAARYARGGINEPLTAYQCACGSFHLGRTPDRLKKGGARSGALPDKLKRYLELTRSAK